jgi:mRNA interferase MazF
MEQLMKGDIVVLPFPFSDLSKSKRRPALVAASLTGDDLILCQITSETRRDNYSVSLEAKDFKKGKLDIKSMLRPNKIFTADKSIIVYKIGTLKETKTKKVEKELVKIFTK